MRSLTEQKRQNNAQLENINIQPQPLDALVGYLCVEFNGLERNLGMLLQTLVGCDVLGAGAVWSSMMWRGRLDLLDSLLKARLPRLSSKEYERLYLDFWKDLHDFLLEIGGDRNFVVHGIRVMGGQKDGPSLYRIGPNTYMHTFEFARRRDLLDEMELREIILDIRLATDRLSRFQLSLIERAGARESIWPSHSAPST